MENGLDESNPGLTNGARLAADELDQATNTLADDGPLQRPPDYDQLVHSEEIVQVVYQSDQNGSLVGVESSLLSGPAPAFGVEYGLPATSGAGPGAGPCEASAANNGQQLSRAASTLPSVAEESTSSGGPSGVGHTSEENLQANEQHSAIRTNVGELGEQRGQRYEDSQLNAQHYFGGDQTVSFVSDQDPDAVYSTVDKSQQKQAQQSQASPALYQDLALVADDRNSAFQLSVYDQIVPGQAGGQEPVDGERQAIEASGRRQQLVTTDANNDDDTLDQKENVQKSNEDIGHILRHKHGAVECGSFRQNFRKKLGLSISTNENDLTAYRQKFLESQEASGESESADTNSLAKFKRTHSVSFNVGSTRSNRHSVDIRNLPSYLTHKRTSIVDVARGAMSSLISSFGGGSATGSSISGSQRRDSSPDDEPIFEEPIAPTLSLGQRVALVTSSGAEFGTVGWIGQLPDVDDDWIVGVLFDNMIGNCDGAHNGVRYFYARENYAMFVPLSVLTKTDNYIGRPETGTMLSRMSVSLKPGQLISIQRSSIRLQHCFLNAPHQRVGHDVRAVSNRLHCQCHNCGPCAHLTKQGRITTIPHFGAHHLAHHKKNSLAHAAVELLAHHHHHFHDEEEHEEEDYHFGDNAAHACNYVRYSCCQQNGVDGHEFLNDCEMVRPELLDNLIHAPKAPHRRSRPRRPRRRRPEQDNATGNIVPVLAPAATAPGVTGAAGVAAETSNQSTLDATISRFGSDKTDREADDAGSSYSSGSSHSSSPADSQQEVAPAHNYYQCDSSTYRPTTNGVYNTMDSQISIMDQQRFIYQRDSSALIHYQPSNFSDDQQGRTGGVGKSIMRCFTCFRKRGRSKGKRRLSAKDRMLEYRRRQSTFVPSTLAKPQEDFASHGIILPSTSPNAQDANSDYSSYSKSSYSSSSHSLGYPGGDETGTRVDQAISDTTARQTIGSLDQRNPDHSGQLKSFHTLVDYQGTMDSQLNYDDYSFGDGHDSYKKNESSWDSALTDLGCSDTYKTNSSSDTLKQLVDRSINEQVVLPEQILNGIQEDPIVSPISSAEVDNVPSDQVDISSATASVVDEEVRSGVEGLELD